MKEKKFLIAMKYWVKKYRILLFFSPFLLLHCNTHIENSQDLREINAKINIISGNHQIGEGGRTLTKPVVLKVTDLNQNPIQNLEVSLKVVEGGGSIISGSNLFTDPSGIGSFQWIIGSSYNGIELNLSSDTYQTEPAYVCAVGENPSGIHITRTISSFRKVGEALYEITFYGNYRSGTLYQTFNSTLSENRFSCSLFAVFGNLKNYLMGRSFDNPSGWVCLTLMTRINPLDGYASIAPVRMKDIGFGPEIDFNSVPFIGKNRLLDAAVNPPDGVNELGLAVGLANVTPQPYIRDPDKQTISCVLLVRKILDHARTVNEAVEIAAQYNISSSESDTLNIHAMVADADGRSIILEPANGEMKIIRNTRNFQVMTNSPVYHVSIENQIAQCWRFRTIYERLDSSNGFLTSNKAVDLLQEVGNQWTEWSAVYGITAKEATMAIDFHFDTLYDFYIFPLW